MNKAKNTVYKLRINNKKNHFSEIYQSDSLTETQKFLEKLINGCKLKTRWKTYERLGDTWTEINLTEERTDTPLKIIKEQYVIETYQYNKNINYLKRKNQ